MNLSAMGRTGALSESTTESTPDRPVLSIVTTLYNSADTIEAFYNRAVAAAEAITDAFELVIVDDGSPDDALAIALRIAARDPRVKLIELSRNFGHHKALMTGMMHAAGEFCFLIDSDLEEDPALLGRFWETLRESGMDVIYGYQAQRAGDGFRRLSGVIAYGLLDLLVPYKIPRNLITVRLMRRAYVGSLIRHQEQQTVIGGLWVITGYRQLGIPVEKGIRKKPSYGFRRRWALLFDSITSFSELPLIAVFYLGVGISLLAGIVGITLIILRLAIGVALEGWVSVMLSVWFLGGLAIFCIGVIGLYISKIFIETKGRPYTIIRRVHQCSKITAESSIRSEGKPLRDPSSGR